MSWIARTNGSMLVREPDFVVLFDVQMTFERVR